MTQLLRSSCTGSLHTELLDYPFAPWWLLGQKELRFCVVYGYVLNAIEWSNYSSLDPFVTTPLVSVGPSVGRVPRVLLPADAMYSPALVQAVRRRWVCMCLCALCVRAAVSPCVCV